MTRWWITTLAISLCTCSLISRLNAFSIAALPCTLCFLGLKQFSLNDPNNVVNQNLHHNISYKMVKGLVLFKTFDLNSTSSITYLHFEQCWLVAFTHTLIPLPLVFNKCDLTLQEPLKCPNNMLLKRPITIFYGLLLMSPQFSCEPSAEVRRKGIRIEKWKNKNKKLKKINQLQNNPFFLLKKEECCFILPCPKYVQSYPHLSKIQKNFKKMDTSRSIPDTCPCCPKCSVRTRVEDGYDESIYAY